MHRLFSVAKIPVFCDTYAPAVEKRRGEEVAILTLRLRVQPFDAKMATSLDDGVGGDSNVRSTVFSHTTEPKPHFTRHDFQLALDMRQLLTVFASTDTEQPHIALDQVRIHGTYIRSQRDVNMLAFCFKASFGPVSPKELEFVHSWCRGQRAITFTPSEGELEFDEENDGDDDDDGGGEDQPPLPAPMFDDPRDMPPAPLQTKRRGRQQPAAEE